MSEEIKKCMFCKGELTEMKDDKGKVTCVRCLKCKPIVEPPKPKAVDDSKRVDQPWTPERIWDAIESKVLEAIDQRMKPDVVPDEPEVVTAGEGEAPKDVEIPLEPPKWNEQAEELGIPWRGRKKEDVLDEIEAKLTVPDEG